ncbi:hypothetical protein B0H11DRAFT_1907078 [Mycena galericulata]|nr:hypothetical protein B0H11DRAFT_1907078 [Mycena galericulata]
MTAALAQHLPPEVVDFIMDGNSNNKRALASCSLVCKAWLQSSRYHLFSEFDIYVGPNVGTSFLKLLHHPLCTFIYCIRSISIYPGAPDQDGVAGLGEKTVTGLAKLKHVASLRIHNHRGLIPKSTLALLASTFNEVTTLRITNSFPSFNDAIEFVAQFPALKILDFYPYCVDRTPITSPETTLPPNLHSLKLHSPFSYHSWFSERSEHFPSLALTHVQPPDIDTAKEILTAFGSDLFHLYISFPSGSFQCSSAFSVAINFHSNARLSSLEIVGAQDEDLLPFVRNMRAPSLQILEWYLLEKFSRTVYGPTALTIPWAEVDSKVADRVAFKGLKELHFHFSKYFERKKHLLGKFPKAEALGIAIVGK